MRKVQGSYLSKAYLSIAGESSSKQSEDNPYTSDGHKYSDAPVNDENVSKHSVKVWSISMRVSNVQRYEHQY